MQPHHVLSVATTAVRPGLEVANIFRLYGPQYRDNNPVSKQQRKAMKDIERCRTAALGGHVDLCDQGCGFSRISYNSCRNRNCPKCQGLQSARWLEKRFDRILPTHYFHMVFTVPHELLGIILRNKAILYRILFQAAANSLLEFAKQWERLQAQVGFTAILHTWNQDMQFHPHLHIVVTGGGLDQSQTKWIASRNNFLVPVRGLSKKFRGKFIHLLKKAHTQGLLVMKENSPKSKADSDLHGLTNFLYRKKWVVYSKNTFGDPEQVFKYLGLYTHKVAISNHRLVEMADSKVTFLARDNANPGQKRTVTVTAQEFIRRFLLHILPKGFVKIRHYGLMAPRNAKTKLEIARRLIEQALPQSSQTDSDSQVDNLSGQAPWQDLLLRITGVDITKCPSCGGNLTRTPLSFFQDSRSIAASVPIFKDSS